MEDTWNRIDYVYRNFLDASLTIRAIDTKAQILLVANIGIGAWTFSSQRIAANVSIGLRALFLAGLISFVAALILLGLTLKVRRISSASRDGATPADQLDASMHASAGDPSRLLTADAEQFAAHACREYTLSQTLSVRKGRYLTLSLLASGCFITCALIRVMVQQF